MSAVSLKWVWSGHYWSEFDLDFIEVSLIWTSLSGFDLTSLNGLDLDFIERVWSDFVKRVRSGLYWARGFDLKFTERIERFDLTSLSGFELIQTHERLPPPKIFFFFFLNHKTKTKNKTLFIKTKQNQVWFELKRTRLTWAFEWFWLTLWSGLHWACFIWLHWAGLIWTTERDWSDFIIERVWSELH